MTVWAIGLCCHSSKCISEVIYCINLMIGPGPPPNSYRDPIDPICVLRVFKSGVTAGHGISSNEWCAYTSSVRHCIAMLENTRSVILHEDYVQISFQIPHRPTKTIIIATTKYVCRRDATLFQVLHFYGDRCVFYHLHGSISKGLWSSVYKTEQ